MDKMSNVGEDEEIGGVGEDERYKIIVIIFVPCLNFISRCTWSRVSISHFFTPKMCDYLLL